MPKLNKTQNRILATLALKGRFTAVMCSGQGALGGRIKGGDREYSACNSLLKAGLVRLIYRDRDTQTRAGYSIHYSTIVIGLLEKAC